MGKLSGFDRRYLKPFFTVSHARGEQRVASHLTGGGLTAGASFVEDQTQLHHGDEENSVIGNADTSIEMQVVDGAATGGGGGGQGSTSHAPGGSQQRYERFEEEKDIEDDGQAGAANVDDIELQNVSA